MKVEIIEKSQESEIKYPCLMQSDNGQIIFVISSECRDGHKFYQGTLIKAGKYSNLVGEFDDSWLASAFTLFDGKLVLSND